jgi:glycogen phosphorylase
MPRLHTYTVTPTLPARLAALHELAYNLRWSWDHATRDLFLEVGGQRLWEETDRNPARLLGLVAQERLDELATDTAFLTRLDAAQKTLKADLERPSPWPANLTIGYFSAEFGIAECLPIYSGGLGVLAGDHLKAASDLALPLVGVGFLYQRGYFRQALNADGWQVENYPVTDFYSLPVTPTEHVVTVDFPGRKVHALVWKAQVGRIPLYLLDTNLEQNQEADRHIVGNLYGGDNETRIQQELILGIGGVRALDALGISPSVCHMNEGHSAFLALERIRQRIATYGLSFEVAAQAAAASHLFTTHTPVPAGFDLFPEDLMRRYFGDYAASLGLSFDGLMERGRHPHGDRDKFNMAVLAFRHARRINGVSKLHGVVSRKMAASVWEEFPLDEVPIGSVTNGIHTNTFLSAEMAELLARYPEPTAIPDAELWSVRNTRRKKLVEWAREYAVHKCEKRGASDHELDVAHELLDPDVLTIGFARRFATYKRGDLLLRDIERLKRLVNHADRPVQFVFAGKAHPRDDAGKELIRRIVHATRDESLRTKVVFLEDYDMNMARYLVQGVDVWLNNPRRPMEASGTSGMKVVPNGGLNFSVLDGWWAEAYDPSVGWAIGRGEDYDDLAYQDHIESLDIYETLESEIAPLFYERDAAGLPLRWLAKMKASMSKLAPVYSTGRMVREYAETYYLPAAEHAARLAVDNLARAHELVDWKKKLRESWGEVAITSVVSGTEHLAAGESAPVTVTVRLGATLAPGDVRVELYAGPIDTDRNLHDAHSYPLETVESLGDGQWRYEGTLPSTRSGRLGYGVRVLPSHPDAILPQELPLIAWEE